MTERLPNSGETSWQNILGANDGSGGFLRVAHNDDGTLKSGVGGFAVGSSYLKGAAADTNNNASGPVTLTWTASASAGSDVAVDAGDSTKINILTSGWYSLRFAFDAFTDSGTDFAKAAAFTIRVNGVDRWQLFFSGDAATPQIGDWRDAIALPAQDFTAGDSIIFLLSLSGLGGTWSSDLTLLDIVRLA